MKIDLQNTIIQYVDFLMPALTLYEAVMYIFLLRNSYIKANISEIRIGKRTIAENWAKGSRGEKTNYSHVSKLIKGLEAKGCVKIGDTNREGTLYTVLLPEEIPLVKEKLLVTSEPDEDFFTDPEKREEIFKRDKWICFYCGERVNSENSTLDHLIPQYKGGKNTKENLKTSCLVCNSIKSGKTQEEAAPYLLKSIQERRTKGAV